MSFLDKYSKSEIAEFISQSVNFADVLGKMGQSTNSGSNRLLISHYVKENNIDISHFDNSSKIRTPKDIFIENSTATQATLRRHYKKGNYSEYKCAICGLEPFWNGQELTLTLDHINGVNNDHRMDNLRWICPNCDRQLPTYEAKRKKKHAFCKQCGLEISHKNKTGLCKDCYYDTVLSNPNSNVHINRRNLLNNKQDNSNKKPYKNTCQTCGKPISKNATFCEDCFHTSSRKTNRPEPLDLAKQIIEFGFEGVGKKFGVSGSSVKKWCKHYDIPHTKRELINWYNEQTNL